VHLRDDGSHPPIFPFVAEGEEPVIGPPLIEFPCGQLVNLGQRFAQGEGELETELIGWPL
jgi:hypothetical protein